VTEPGPQSDRLRDRRPSATSDRADTPGTLTWRHLYQLARERLGSDAEARHIVERASGRDGAEWLLVLDQGVPHRALAFFDDMVERRAADEPLQYVLRRWGFRGLDLLVDRRVLIPRPETEVVVEVAIRELRRLGTRRPLAADLGTGSGAIALALASEVGEVKVWATDASPGALAVARANLAGLGSPAAVRVRLAQGGWFDALPAVLRGQYDLIVSNPPYIAAGERLPAEVAEWEPVEALVAGERGTEAIAELVAGAPAWLARPASLVLEIAPHQAEEAIELAGAAGFGDVDVRPDLAGRLRVLVARIG
jgi:release factor glutamine methyltransferase